MVYVAVDGDNEEYIYSDEPMRVMCNRWSGYEESIPLPKGSIEKLIGRKLTWEDEPVELKGE